MSFTTRILSLFSFFFLFGYIGVYAKLPLTAIGQYHLVLSFSFTSASIPFLFCFSIGLFFLLVLSLCFSLCFLFWLPLLHYQAVPRPLSVLPSASSICLKCAPLKSRLRCAHSMASSTLDTCKRQKHRSAFQRQDGYSHLFAHLWGRLSVLICFFFCSFSLCNFFWRSKSVFFCFRFETLICPP